MSDIQDKLNQILSNPEALKQVQSLGEQLGLTQKSEPAPVPPKPNNDITSMLSGDTLSTITRLAPLMQSVKQDDNITRLLLALKPFLSPEKQQRLETAERMIKMLKILPLLKGSGIF